MREGEVVMVGGSAQAIYGWRGARDVTSDLVDAEARLTYVAVTRARHRFGLGGRSWINPHPNGNPGAEQAPRSPEPPSGRDASGPAPR
ncbi:hypothetical protein ACFWIA_16870 [Streptomyces sp. NPDC127068]|uniref:hypothetical protein n=1 Tax=Streptomyces sp. NPDC127068 TaxID=3347127 RepID=UPI00364ABC7A